VPRHYWFGLLDYANITHDFGDAFTKFLLTKKAHTNNTVGKYISTFKTFLSWADERGAVLPRDYVKFRVPEEDVKVVALTAEELQMTSRKRVAVSAECILQTVDSPQPLQYNLVRMGCSSFGPLTLRFRAC